MSHQPRQAGFTLLEMIVVVVVLGLMATLLLGRGPLRSPALDANLAANRLAGELRAARMQAVATDRPVAVAVNAAAGTLQVGSATPHALGTALFGPAKPILFLPDGTSGGGSITVAAGRVRRRVSVDWLTGRVSIADAG